MNEIQIYSAIMFLSGVVLTHTVFYLDRVRKKRDFYTLLSAVILQILENVDLAHQATKEFQLEQLKTVDDSLRQEYLEKESKKISVFMDLYVLLFIKAIPEEGRKHINYRSWPEADALIKELRGFIENGQDKG